MSKGVFPEAEYSIPHDESQFQADFKAFLRLNHIEYCEVAAGCNRSVGTVKNWMYGKGIISQQNADMVREVCRRLMSNRPDGELLPLLERAADEANFKAYQHWSDDDMKKCEIYKEAKKRIESVIVYLRTDGEGGGKS